MYVVIFKAISKEIDSEYSMVAARMRELAIKQFGCLNFLSVTEGRQEVSLSYWENESAIIAWKQHSEHVIAQQTGRERWYESYSVEVASITRSYNSAN